MYEISEKTTHFSEVHELSIIDSVKHDNMVYISKVRKCYGELLKLQ